MAFDYLADPRNRPEWQSSLRRVELLDEGRPRVGMRWVDVTWAGIRPEMQLKDYRRPHGWSEWGGWRDVASAHLGLAFQPAAGGCVVTASFGVGVGGRLGRWVQRPLRLLARAAIRSDLERAARILSARAAEH